MAATSALRRFALVAAPLGLVASMSPAVAGEMCHVVDVDLMPAEIARTEPMRAPSQIVVWIERPDGTFVDTIFITQQTGSYGLGNRPGRIDFNSGPNWPYGRRTTVFPVWAHRHGLLWPEVVFQDGNDDHLSQPFKMSSDELHYCRPLLRTEPMWDAVSCASLIKTDKGALEGPVTNRYPPRADLIRKSEDDLSVDMFAMLNPFDAISHPTPVSGTAANLTWPIPEGLPMGDYVLWVEVSREFDHNETYSVEAYPSPTHELKKRCRLDYTRLCTTDTECPGADNACEFPVLPYKDYGEAYRGQPSVLYSVPVTLGTTQSTARTLDYVGYSDPDGLDGNLRAPDDTISTGVAGSGAERLAIQSDGDGVYRVRVVSRVEMDYAVPAAPRNPGLAKLTSSAARIEFVAPGDDGLTGRVTGYELRYLANGDITEETFAAAIDPRVAVHPADPGTMQEFELTGLLYETDYTVAIRALDDCHNTGPIATLQFTTPEREIGEVDACFVATAAYGSAMANDVELLRRFRDVMLRDTVLGELAVEAYYTFGPAVAGVVGESDLLRATARAVLDPIVGTVRVLEL